MFSGRGGKEGGGECSPLLTLPNEVECVLVSLIPRLPDLFNARERRGGAWDLMSRA